MESNLKEIGYDLLHYIPARILPSLINFLSIAIYTRLLNPEEYGLYIIVLTTGTFISSIFFSCIIQANIRLFEKYRVIAEDSKFITTNFLFFVLLTFFVSSAYLGIINYLNHINLLSVRLSYLFKIGTLLLFFESNFRFGESILRALRKSRKYKFFLLLKVFGSFFISVFLIYFLQFKSEGILIGIIVSCVFLVPMIVIDFFEKWIITFRNFSKEILKNSLTYGVPMSLSSIGALILSISDRYMIKYFFDSEAVGIYSVGYRISEMSILLIAGTMMLAAFPIIINTYESSGKYKTQILIKKLTGFYSLLMMPMVFGLASISRELTDVFLGDKFSEAYLILPWVALGAFFKGLTQFINKSYELTEKTKEIFILVFVAALINIFVNIFLIPKFGFLGAAFSTVIAYLAYLIFSWYSTKSYFRWIVPWKTMVKAFIGSLLMFSLIVFINLNSMILLSLLIKIILGCIIYLLILFIVKEENLIKAFHIIKNKI